MFDMRRREFITLLGGVASGWPLVARAQQADRMRRIGVLVGLAENDPEQKLRIAAFLDGLRELGWIEGRNLGITYRFGANDPERRRAYAAELVSLTPDVILANSTPVLPAIREATQTVSTRPALSGSATSVNTIGTKGHGRHGDLPHAGSD
jgi:putative ABC transport system substrate-binding protein